MPPRQPELIAPRGLPRNGGPPPELYRDLVANAPIGVFVATVEGAFLIANDALASLAGYSTVEELTGCRASDLFEDPGHFDAFVERLVAAGTVSGAMVQWKRRDGSALPVEIDARLAVQEEKTVIEAFARVSPEERQQRLQEAIQASAREWQQTFDAIEHPIVILDLRGLIRELNEAARRLAATGRGVIGAPVQSLGPGQPWLAMAEAGHRPAGGEAVEVHDSNGRIWEITTSRFSAPSIAEQRDILIARDVTRMDELRQALGESEQMSAMGSLVAGVAHEVRTPLFGISSTIDALETVIPPNDDTRSCIRILREQAERLRALMTALLDYGKPSREERQEVDLKDLIETAVANALPAATAGSVTIRSEVPEDLPRIRGDRTRLMQVFHNLLDNAIAYAPTETTVTVVTTRRFVDGRHWVACIVRDQGPGFIPEEISQVFDPFYSRRKHGTGLGLSMVRRIVTEHGGRVSAANGREGAVLSVLLPISLEAA